MSIQELNWAYRQQCFGDEKLLLLCLAFNADRHHATMPLKNLAEFIGRAPSTTRRALSALVRRNLIERRGPDGYRLGSWQ